MLQLFDNLHVKPILSDKCFSCHGPDMAKQKAGLRLDMPASAFADLPESPGKVAIDPGDLNGSELFHWFMSQSKPIKGYTKSIWSGVTTIELAKAVRRAISQNTVGLYQITNNNKITKFDLLNLIHFQIQKNL